MTDEQQDPDRDRGSSGVGSVGEEAAKLFEALQDWGAAGGGGGAGGAGGLGGLGVLADQLRSLNEHIASGGKDCVYCPVCQLIHKARAASPELREHLAVAASSLLQAAAMVIEARAARPAPRETGVTRIDIDEDPGPGSRPD